LRDANENQFTVDAELRVLAAGCSQAPDLAYVSRSVLNAKPGDFVTSEALVALRRDAQALVAPSSAPALRFTKFAFDAAGQLDATLAGGVRIRFGDDDALAEKERLVGPILASLGSRAANVRAVDLRAPATPVVEFR
jgi:hypothetical protein